MGKAVELQPGERFGYLTIVEMVRLPNGRRKWKCRCDCGNMVLRDAGQLRDGNTTSCGCKRNVFIDLTGKRFGHLTVLGRAEDIIEPSGRHRVRWKCQCDCGNICYVSRDNLGKSTISCGCHKNKSTSERFSAKLEGKIFGKLKVLKRVGTQVQGNGDQKSLWLCECECGTKVEVIGKNLLNGNTQSCGCTVSRGELQVREILNFNKIRFVAQKTYSDLTTDRGGKPRFDFALLNNSNEVVGLIEYQGIQHYKNTGIGELEREETDQLKRNYCAEHKIPLLEIPYNQNAEELLMNFLKSINYTPTLCQASQEEGLTTIPEGSNE